jgi:DnaJ-class molecular chaperone
MIAALLELEEQADRIRAGVACKECLGAGKLAVFSRIGVQWRACPTCDGSGTRK